MAKKLMNVESIFKLCLLAFFLQLLWTGREYPEKSRMFPTALGGVAIILIVISLIQTLTRSKGEEKKEEVWEREG